MAPEISIPYETMISLGRDLADISEKLAADNQGSADVMGLDDPAQSPINDAIASFRDEWGESIGKLSVSIGSFGEISTQIGTSVRDFDYQVAAGLKPPSAGPSAGSNYSVV